MRSSVLLATSSKPPSRQTNRPGQALVEFAIIAFVLTLLLSAMLTFGFLLFGANVLQQAADVGAQEFARLPLPPTARFPDLGDNGYSSTDPSADIEHNVFAHEQFREQIFDERHLVVDLDEHPDVDLFFADKPLINRLLRPLMIYQETGGLRLVRYPGALVENRNTGRLTVLIPLVTSRAASGEETAIEWRAVVEEIRDANSNGPLNLIPETEGADSGIVALRINYPFQSGAMIAYQYELEDGSFSGSTSDALGQNVINHPVTANDGGFDPPDPYELVVEANDVNNAFRTHSGQYGMGHLGAFAKQVRPYRKVLTAQAIYRREVFE